MNKGKEHWHGFEIWCWLIQTDYGLELFATLKKDKSFLPKSFALQPLWKQGQCLNPVFYEVIGEARIFWTFSCSPGIKFLHVHLGHLVTVTCNFSFKIMRSNFLCCNQNKWGTETKWCGQGHQELNPALTSCDSQRENGLMTRMWSPLDESSMLVAMDQQLGTVAIKGHLALISEIGERTKIPAHSSLRSPW
jgi:hypothetical protein